MKSLQLTKLQKLALRSGVRKLVLSLKDSLDVERARDSEGNSLVLLAVKYKKLNLLKLFLDWGVSPSITNDNDDTALKLAKEGRLQQFVDVLENYLDGSSDEINFETGASSCDHAVSDLDGDKSTHSSQSLAKAESCVELGVEAKKYTELETDQVSEQSLICEPSDESIESTLVSHEHEEPPPSHYSSSEFNHTGERTISDSVQDSSTSFPGTDFDVFEYENIDETSEINGWESEEAILRPANNDELQSRVEDVVARIRDHRPNRDLDESWSHVVIDLPVVSRGSVESDRKFSELSRYLGALVEQSREISPLAFSRHINELPDDQKPYYSEEEWHSKLEDIGVRFNELSSTCELINTDQVSSEECERVDAILAENYSISELWIARIFQQASNRDVLSREGEVEIAVRMDAALLGVKELLSGSQCINLKEQIQLSLGSTFAESSREGEEEQSDEHSNDDQFIETELDLVETREFLAYLVDKETDKTAFIPRPSEEEISYLRQQFSTVSPDVESKYDYFINRYHQSRNQFFESNLRLVYSLAKRYRTTVSLQIEDFVQFGFIGLLRAIEKWNYTLGYKFSTYATWWIRQSITRAYADFGLTVRLPVHVYEKLNKLKTEQDRFEREGVLAPLEHLASVLDVSVPAVRRLIEIDADYIASEHLINIAPSDLMYNSADCDDDAALIVSDERRSNYIALALAHLTDKERDIITKRFGLFDEAPHTLEEIGQLVGVTRERIRQIESKAIKKLSGPTFTTYFDGEDIYLNWKALEQARMRQKLNKPEENQK